jgi:hypothetical protein
LELLQKVECFSRIIGITSWIFFFSDPTVDRAYYQRSTTEFVCKDGSKTISLQQVNDDFCDCADGSDEPGTAACSPKGNFYCQNKGYVGEFIPTSHVRDGICGLYIVLCSFWLQVVIVFWGFNCSFSTQ